MRHHATKQPRRLGGRAVAVLFGLAVTALPGCREDSPTGPEEPAAAAQEARTDALEAEFIGDRSAASPAAAGSPGLTATRLPKSFFVNPKTGKDTNPGTKLLPFKTLARGLSSAIAKDTMRLASGVYSAATNGERFTITLGELVRVPAGVMILGTLSGGDITSQLRGAGGGETGLNLQGAVTVRNVALAGFSTGIRATQGVQSLKNVVLDQNVVGIDLSGSARATLVVSSVFLTPPPIRVAGSIVGVNVAQQARLALVSSTIGERSQNCRSDVKGVSLRDAAQLTLKNGATFRDIAGTALSMSGASKATLTSNATITRSFSQLPDGCTPAPSVISFDSASLTLKKARIWSTGGTNAIGIQPLGRGLLTLDSTQVTGHTGAGIRIAGLPRVIVSGSLFRANNIGIDGFGANSNTSITITGSTVFSNTTGIRAPFFKLRNSVVSSNETGIVLTSPFTDLGETTDPGNNTITGNVITGVTFGANVISGGVGGIFASGNTWNPSTQGSDGSGRYPGKPVLNNSSPLASGKNFILPKGDSNDLFQIQL